MNKSFILIATTAFGLEALVKAEITRLGYEIVKVENGRVYYRTDLAGIVNSNLWLRCADRVLLMMGAFRATTFEELFQGTKKIAWEKLLPVDARFPAAKITSVKSKLFSKSDGQRIVKKAVVERLKEHYKVDWFEESGALFPIHIQILKDEVVLSVDTSGSGLHKRGYRRYASAAPIKETMAAALVYLSRWQPHRYFIDPLCGSGTIVIEAAMIGRNMAPGLKRDFAAEDWPIVPDGLWQALKEQAKAEENNKTFRLLGSDKDASVLKQARTNAQLAGVADFVSFQTLSVEKLTTRRRYGVIITNPPYGERLGENKENRKLYRTMGEVFANMPDWSYFIICGYPEFEKAFGKKADKNRKLYNSMIKTYYYQYYGPLPPKIKESNEQKNI